MQIIIIFVSSVILHVKCLKKDSTLVSAEYDSFVPLANDRIDVYNYAKSDVSNSNKERLYVRNRRVGVYPLVEVGPGSFKADYKKLPPEFLVGHFKKLLAIKKKMEKNKN